MKIFSLTLASMMLISESEAIKVQYKSDDMDDLIGSIIQNKHTKKEEYV